MNKMMNRLGDPTKHNAQVENILGVIIVLDSPEQTLGILN